MGLVSVVVRYGISKFKSLSCVIQKHTFCRVADDKVHWKVTLKTRSSSKVGTRGFCPECGSQLSFISSRWPGEVHLYAATLDDPSGYSPDLHCYTSEHLDWLNIEDYKPRYPKSAPGSLPVSRN